MVYAYQPVDTMQAFGQAYQFSRGLREEREQQQAAEQKKRDLVAAIADLRANPSPERIAEFGLMFPEMKEEMDGYYKTLDEGKKRTMRDAAQAAIIAQRTGGDVASVFAEYAAAAENSGNQAMAQQFRDAAEFAKANPDAAAETARLNLAFTDPDAYKLVYNDAMYDTAFMKELIGEGLRPGTPEFQQALREKREGDPWVAVPGVGLFMREQLEAAAASGQAAVAPNIPEGAVQELIKNPGTASQFDEIFGKGAAARILGGTGSNAGGNFR